MLDLMNESTALCWGKKKPSAMFYMLESDIFKTGWSELKALTISFLYSTKKKTTPL